MTAQEAKNKADNYVLKNLYEQCKNKIYSLATSGNYRYVMYYLPSLLESKLKEDGYTINYYGRGSCDDAINGNCWIITWS